MMAMRRASQAASGRDTAIGRGLPFAVESSDPGSVGARDAGHVVVGHVPLERRDIPLRPGMAFDHSALR